MDLITSANGKAIEVYPGGGEKPFGRRNAIQKLSTVGTVHFDTLLQVGRNLGQLPHSQRSSSIGR